MYKCTSTPPSCHVVVIDPPNRDVVVPPPVVTYTINDTRCMFDLSLDDGIDTDEDEVTVVCTLPPPTTHASNPPNPPLLVPAPLLDLTSADNPPPLRSAQLVDLSGSSNPLLYDPAPLVDLSGDSLPLLLNPAPHLAPHVRLYHSLHIDVTDDMDPEISSLTYHDDSSQSMISVDTKHADPVTTALLPPTIITDPILLRSVTLDTSARAITPVLVTPGEAKSRPIKYGPIKPYVPRKRTKGHTVIDETSSEDGNTTMPMDPNDINAIDPSDKVPVNTFIERIDRRRLSRNMKRSRNMAVVYYYIHVLGFPAKDLWCGGERTISKISKALDIPTRKRDGVIRACKQVLRCMKSERTYDGTTRHLGKRSIIEDGGGGRTYHH